MRAAAVVCTYGRAELGELLACVARQTLELPTLVYLDGARVAFDSLPPSVDVCAGPRASSLGMLRRTAVDVARVEYELGELDAVLVLDDDDFYSSQHYELTLRALELAGPNGWTGALAMGFQLDGGPLELVHGEAGVGQHATWSYRLGAYDAAGGYLDVHQDEDTALGHSLGWKNCRAHHYVTHVRRQHSSSISSARVNFDRELVRSLTRCPPVVRPLWTPELEQLERWCVGETLELATPRP
jgi:hypothetical protein